MILAQALGIILASVTVSMLVLLVIASAVGRAANWWHDRERERVWRAEIASHDCDSERSAYNRRDAA